MVGAYAFLALVAVSSVGAISPLVVETVKQQVSTALDWAQSYTLSATGGFRLSGKSDAKNQWTATLAEVSVPKIDYETKSLDVQAATQTIGAVITVSKLAIKGSYSASGIIEGGRLEGYGGFTAEMRNTKGMISVKLGTSGNKLVATSVDTKFTGGDVKVTAEGLKVGGTIMPNRFVSKKILNSIRNDANRLQTLFSDALKIAINGVISGSRFEKVRPAINNLLQGKIIQS